jgi:hypothetical protein
MNEYERKSTDLVPIAGEFDGYYINRFNDVLSYQTSKPKPIGITTQRKKSSELEVLQLYDDDGIRRIKSRRKILIESLGKEEFESRETNRENKGEILAKEEREAQEYMKKQQEEAKRESDRELFAYEKAALCNVDVFTEWKRLGHDQYKPERGDKEACEKAQDAWVEQRLKQNILDDRQAKIDAAAEEERQERFWELYNKVSDERAKRPGAEDNFELCLKETSERFKKLEAQTTIEEDLGELF